MSRSRFAFTFALVLLAPARALAQPAPGPVEPTRGEAPLLPTAPTAPTAPAEGVGQTPEANLPPTSTSGTDVGASEPGAAAAVAEAPADTKQDARIRALEQRLARDEQHMRRLEGRLKIFKHLRFESFIQPQLLVQTFNSAASPNLQPDGTFPVGITANDTIAKPDGTTTNGTFFRVRRARLRTFYETDVMRLFLQIDALPAGGIGPGVGTILRNAEATGIVRWTRDVRTEFTAGLFFTPFRAELLEASVARPFIERTWFIQNVFPTERDYGAHMKTVALDDHLDVDLAIVNGQRLGERTFVALPDLNRSKDFLGRATYKLGFVKLGASGYLGRGQVVDPQALRFKQFDRHAVNFEAAAAHRVLRDVGDSRLSAELTFGRNMDSGVNYSFAVPRIPNDITRDVEDIGERALYVRFEQDIKRYVTLGYRYDMYSPDTAIKNNARDTHAFLAVWKISPNLRFMSELGWAIDNVHPLNTPAPSRHIVYFSNVLQAMF